MKTLIIGGTKGFGKEISDQFSARRYDVVTVSRFPHGKNHYACDVGDLHAWKKTLDKIKTDHESIDALACIVGYARAKPSQQLTADDWNETIAKNLTYVALAFQELTGLLSESNNPRAITIGSQWSYKVGCDVLVPYTVAKHALRTLTEDIADRNPRLNVNHYCVPTMDTPGYWDVKETFTTTGKERTIESFTPEGLADPKVIAKSMIDFALHAPESGKMFVIDNDGRIVSWEAR